MRCLLALMLVGGLAAAEVRPPNVLILMADDMRWDALSVVQREQGPAARFPWFPTPNLDRLARQGTRFRNAMVVNSLCSPSRACFLTGRYNHVNGVTNNHTTLPPGTVTWATELQQAGYETGYIGKWHMGDQTGQRPGCSWSASFVGQGRFFDCPVEVDGRPRPTRGWVDDVSTDFAIDFLRRHQGRPFALQVGFKSPHDPRLPPERARNRFAGAMAGPVPNLHVPAIYLGLRRTDPAPDAGARRMAGHLLDYFRCISAMDEDVGRILDTVEELHLTENTLVVFTSDNGYYLGEHMLTDKRSMYDECLRIPFLARLPGRIPAGAVEDALVLNLDLAPTLCELAGIPRPASMMGRSWLGLAGGNPPTWRSGFLYEYFHERGNRSPPIVGLRTTGDKLITYPGHPAWTEIFDLARDPYEITNLARDPARREHRERLLGLLDAERAATGYRVPAYVDAMNGGPGPRHGPRRGAPQIAARPEPGGTDLGPADPSQEPVMDGEDPLQAIDLDL